VGQAGKSWLPAALWLAWPLLYIPEWFKVLTLDGSEFSLSGNGWPLVAALLLPALTKRWGSPLSSHWTRALAAMGALSGVWLYGSVRTDGFDEQSALGSACLALMGVALGACRARMDRPQAKSLLLGALPLAGAHLFSLRSTHAPILCLALLLALAADRAGQSESAERSTWSTQCAPSALWGYLLALPLYQGGLGAHLWIWHFALAPLALALGAWLPVGLAIKRPALCLPSAAILAWALPQGLLNAGFGLGISGLAALAIGRQWARDQRAPCGLLVGLGFGLAYLESQRSTAGMLLPVLIVACLLEGWPRAAPQALRVAGAP
jgi:hypothetical protein